MEKIKVLLGWSGQNYSACTEDYDLLCGVVIATGKTYNDLKRNFESALEFHIEGCLNGGDKLPDWLVNGEYEIAYNHTVAALLHSLDGILTRSAISRATGINQKQIGHYASGVRNPRPEKRRQIVEGIHQISRELASVM